MSIGEFILFNSSIVYLHRHRHFPFAVLETPLENPSFCQKLADLLERRLDMEFTMPE